MNFAFLSIGQVIGIFAAVSVFATALYILKLRRRTGDERWLERARAFAMHALDQLDGARFSLWTGDVGTALYLRACIDGDDRFPTIDYW